MRAYPNHPPAPGPQWVGLPSGSGMARGSAGAFPGPRPLFLRGSLDQMSADPQMKVGVCRSAGILAEPVPV
jgi:hypothetical protein